MRSAVRVRCAVIVLRGVSPVRAGVLVIVTRHARDS
jgi:hypothetical protein